MYSACADWQCVQNLQGLQHNTLVKNMRQPSQQPTANSQ